MTAKKRTFQRLLRLRELEEEQSRLELESAVANANRVARELDLAVAEQAQGRLSFASGIREGHALERTGGLFQAERAALRQTKIRPRLAAAEVEMAKQREEFLMRRAGRRQVETLIDEEQKTATKEIARRAQQMLDDWYGRGGMNGGRTLKQDRREKGRGAAE